MSLVTCNRGWREGKCDWCLQWNAGKGLEIGRVRSRDSDVKGYSPKKSRIMNPTVGG